MKLFRVTYKIYDDFGELLRIVLDKPNKDDYDYTVVKELVFDTKLCEEALF
jgi:hypothetical protein